MQRLAAACIQRCGGDGCAFPGLQHDGGQLAGEGAEHDHEFCEGVHAGDRGLAGACTRNGGEGGGGYLGEELGGASAAALHAGCA